MLLLGEVVDQLHGWYPPETADEHDAVGLAYGDPAAEVRRVMFSVDISDEVAREAAEWDADLLVTHHPLFLRPVHGVARTTPKGRTLAVLAEAGCGLLAAHTNADQAVDGVSESLALALGLTDFELADPDEAATGSGRIGTVEPTTLAGFAARVAATLPATPVGVLVGGEADRPVGRVAVAGGAGDFLLDAVRRTDADVYVTSDLRHHLAIEFLEHDGPALIQVSHWAAEWMWLPVVEAKLARALGDTVQTYVSTICTDAWRHRLAQDTPRSTR